MTTWTLGYIDDAATARIDIRSRDGQLWVGNSNYDPLPGGGAGVHLCGQTDDGEQPTTVANFEMACADEARTAWNLAREAAACDFEDADFIVDLFIDGDGNDDFPSNRQLWPRAIAAWNDAQIEGRKENA